MEIVRKCDKSNCYRRGVTLAWKPPKDDGGIEISGYRVEYQELGARDWEQVPEQVSLLSCTVRNLEKGKQYKFRVFAENVCGLSEPLNGDPVTAKDPFGIFDILRIIFSSFQTRPERHQLLKLPATTRIKCH